MLVALLIKPEQIEARGLIDKVRGVFRRWMGKTAANSIPHPPSFILTKKYFKQKARQER